MTEQTVTPAEPEQTAAQPGPTGAAVPTEAPVPTGVSASVDVPAPLVPPVAPPMPQQPAHF